MLRQYFRDSGVPAARNVCSNACPSFPKLQRCAMSDVAPLELGGTSHADSINVRLRWSRRRQQGKVVPVILSPCTWRAEDFAKLESLPYKRKPVSSFNPHAKAWKLVEEGIKKAVERARKLPNISTRNLRPMAAR